MNNLIRARSFVQTKSILQRMLVWPLVLLPLVAVGLTFLLVVSGADWWYVRFVYGPETKQVMFIADQLGYIVPIVVPAALLCWGWYFRRRTQRVLGVASAYAVLIAFVLSMALKAITGRESPPHYHRGEAALPTVDTSAAFNFGFLNEQIIGGWPSSHATVMCALATTLIVLTPRRYVLHVCAAGVALFVSVGVSLGWHWLSELVAGVLFGVAVGLAVGRAYRGRTESV